MKTWCGIGLAAALVLGASGCATKLQQELMDRNEMVERLNHKVEELGHEANRERQRAQDFQRENQGLAKANEDLKARLAQQPSEEELLRRMLPAEAEVGWRHSLISIGLPSTVTFPSGKHELTQQGEAILSKVADVIRSRFPDRWLYVAGHTDDQPIQKTKEIYRSNRHLSLERADAVAAFLIASKVPARQIAVIGYGENDPKGPNKTEKGREQNRRVEVLIGPVIGK